MTITIYLTNGTKETYYGDMSIANEAGVINIFPSIKSEPATHIPLANILKYTCER